MSNIYQEAIAEAKKLKEVAEQNAKNAIIEAVAPRIKRLVEQELEAYDLDSDLDEESEYSEFDASEFSDVVDELDSSISSIPTTDASVPDEIVSMDDGEEGENITVNITVEGNEDKIEEVNRLVLSRMKTKRHNRYVKRAASLLINLKEAKNSRKRKKILNEIYALNEVIKKINHKPSSELAKKLTNILKEENSMSRKNGRNDRLNESAWWLFEADEEEGEEGEEVELDLEEEVDEDDEGVDIDVDAIKDAVAALADAVGMETETETEDEAEVELDLEDEAGEDEEDLDLDLEEVYRSMREADVEEEVDENENVDENQVLEISESMLRKEIIRMANSIRRTPSRRKIQEAEAKDADPALAHGGEVIEVDEDTLINALAEELGDMSNNSATGDASKPASAFGGGKIEKGTLPESRRRRIAKVRRQRMQEANKLKALKQRILIAEQTATAAQKELKESNLFNAKLLYVNKLMQQHNLNSKQQRTIVEALDNAKTLREAKLLYTSLTESLNKRKGKSNLSESVNRSGSASKSIRSAAPIKNGSELDRWATLAGIKK